MDKSIASLTLAFAFAGAAIAEPAISALSVTQNSSRVVTIDFTLSETAILTLDLTTNGVSTFFILIFSKTMFSMTESSPRPLRVLMRSPLSVASKMQSRQTRFLTPAAVSLPSVTEPCP